MQEIFSQLKCIPNISIQEIPDASIIRIVKNDTFTFEVTVPESVLEWFVTIRENEREIWKDWADYIPINNEPYSELKEWMQTDIINFVQSVAKSQIRKATSRKLFGTKQTVEWLIDGSWKSVTMSGV